MDLTKRQQEIFDFIRKYSAKYGYPPTVRDIGKAVGLASSSTVHAHLANLEKLGLLRRDRRARTRVSCTDGGGIRATPLAAPPGCRAWALAAPSTSRGGDKALRRFRSLLAFQVDGVPKIISSLPTNLVRS